MLLVRNPRPVSEHWELGWGGACVRQWEKVDFAEHGPSPERKVSVQKTVGLLSRFTRIKDQHLIFCGCLWKGLLFQLMIEVFGLFLFPCSN